MEGRTTNLQESDEDRETSSDKDQKKKIELKDGATTTGLYMPRGWLKNLQPPQSSSTYPHEMRINQEDEDVKSPINKNVDRLVGSDLIDTNEEYAENEVQPKDANEESNVDSKEDTEFKVNEWASPVYGIGEEDRSEEGDKAYREAYRRIPPTDITDYDEKKQILSHSAIQESSEGDDLFDQTYVNPESSNDEDRNFDPEPEDEGAIINNQPPNDRHSPVNPVDNYHAGGGDNTVIVNQHDTEHSSSVFNNTIVQRPSFGPALLAFVAAEFFSRRRDKRLRRQIKKIDEKLTSTSDHNKQELLLLDKEAKNKLAQHNKSIEHSNTKVSAKEEAIPSAVEIRKESKNISPFTHDINAAALKSSEADVSEKADPSRLAENHFNNYEFIKEGTIKRNNVLEVLSSERNTTDKTRHEGDYQIQRSEGFSSELNTPSESEFSTLSARKSPVYKGAVLVGVSLAFFIVFIALLISN